MKANNIFQSIPEKQDEEFFEILAENKNVKIERIVSRGHSSPADGWYDQEQNEWVILLQGEAIITYSDNSQIRMQAGDHVRIPAHTRHRVSWTRPDTETVWLAVHYQ